MAPGGATAAALAPAELVCRISDERLVEISGITWSRSHPGVYWLHNDSGGGPYLYAVDGATCRTLARIRVAGIGARDLEAIATGTDPRGRSVLWLGDVGDNNDSWPSVRIHAIVEPERLVDQEVLATTYRFGYADGAHNAEAILADPSEPRLWVVTKQLATGGVWSVPLSSTAPAVASRIADVGGLVTDAAMSPDGTRYVIRDYVWAYLHEAPVSATSLAATTRIELPQQMQGEAITFTADGTGLLVASEGERALWLVPLRDVASPTSTQTSPTTSAPSGATPSAGNVAGSATPTAVPSTGGAAPGTDPWKLALAGLAVIAAGTVAVAASRRLRG
jgi:hypothetical protein